MSFPLSPWRLLLATAACLLALAPAHAAAAPATWTTFAWNTTFAQPRSSSEAQGLALGGKLYSFGGFDSTKICCTPTSRAYRMDPATGWTALAPMPPENGTSFGGISHAGLATDGTYIYWAGGYTSNAAGTAQIYGTTEVWRYDPATDSYLRMRDLPLTRSAGQLAYLDGKLHYFGGTNPGRTADVGEHWELDLSNVGAGWVARASLPNPRHHMGAAVLGGRIYAIGGQHGHDERLITQDDVHAYDPATDTWTQRADLPRAVGHIASATFVMDGRILVLGGEIAHNSVIADVNAYNPDTDTWTALTKLPSPRRSGVADSIGGVVYYSAGQGSTTFAGVPDAVPAGWPKRFNYQPASAPVPAGYSVDSGRAFDAGRGFGWVREDSLAASAHTPLDVSANAADRNLVGDQRLDTLLQMQRASGAPGVTTPAAWECVLPTGTYDVTVSVGDAAASFDSTHRINLEGAPAVGPFVPTSTSRFASATTTVAVSDGRLTVDARGGTNTKIDYIEIAQSATDPSSPGAGNAGPGGDPPVGPGLPTIGAGALAAQQAGARAARARRRLVTRHGKVVYRYDARRWPGARSVVRKHPRKAKRRARGS
jgi:N-acetylneuraminic acid mutarotase